MKRFYRLTPHFRLSSNPLFALETRRLRRGASPRALMMNTRSTFVIVGVLAMLLWLALVLPASRFTRYSTGLEFALLFAGLSILAGFLLDFSSMFNALTSISGEVVAGRWELLRLTMLTGKQIVTAKHGTAQVRTWSLMSVIIAVRLASLLMIAFTVILTFLDDTGVFTGMPLLTFVAAMVLSGGLGLVFSIEPYWRMRTMTALGLAASARARQPLSTVLVALGTVVAFWLGQGFVVLALTLCSGSLIAPLAAFEAALIQGVVFSPLMLLAFVFFTVYGFYSVIQTAALRRAERFTARLD